MYNADAYNSEFIRITISLFLSLFSNTHTLTSLLGLMLSGSGCVLDD